MQDGVNMAKKKKPLKLNRGILKDRADFDVNDFNLPRTLAAVPKAVAQQNAMAFDAIKPQLEGFLEDGMKHSLRRKGFLHQSHSQSTVMHLRFCFRMASFALRRT